MKSKLIAVAVASVMSAGAFAEKTLEEVTVTAQFKEQTLQETGLAIDAVSADKIFKDGITTIENLADMVPAFTAVNGGGIAGQMFMRGVGNRTNNDYLDPAIIINYDGVAIARSSATSIGGMYDIERVEVLKGPQGTLYGKNATGGVLNIISKRPVIGQTEGYVAGTVGNFSLQNFEGAVNLPLGESSAMRIAASSNEHDGYNNDGTNDDDRTSYRIQFYTELSDNLNIRLSADSTDIGGMGASTSPVGSYSPTFQYIRNDVPLTEGQNTPLANAFRRTVLSAPGFGFLTDIQDDWYVDATLSGYSMELNYTTDAGTLTFIPAYREQEQDSKFNGPGFNSGWWQSKAEQTSFELRFAGDLSDATSYIVGAYQISEDIVGNNTFNQEFVLPLQDYKQTADSWAVFGEFTHNFNDTSRLIAGIRYTDDKKEMDGQINNFIVFCGGMPGNGFTTPPGSFGIGCQIPGNLPHFPTLDTVADAYAFLSAGGWLAGPPHPGPNPLANGKGVVLHAPSVSSDSYADSAPSYRVSFEKDLSETTMAYLSYSRGYHSGGLEPQSGAKYGSEYLDAITLGWKSRSDDGTLQFNGEIFWWDYEDQQVGYFNVNDQNVLQNSTQNIGNTTMKGVDLDVMWLAAENTMLSLKAQYLSTNYDGLTFVTSPPRHNINCPMQVTGALSDGTPVMSFDCSGNDAIYSPEWTVIAGVDHTIPMGGTDLTLSLTHKYVDDQQTGFQNLPHEFIEAYDTTSASMTLEDSEGAWSATAWVRDIQDEHTLQSSQTPLLGLAMGSYSPGMTYGLSARFNF